MSKTPFEAIFFDLGDTLMYFNADWSDIFQQAMNELLHSLQKAGINLEKEFVDEFSQRMAEYYRERDTEFVEYTIKYVLKNVLKEKGYPAVPDETLTDVLADMHMITQAHWIPETDTIPTLERLKLLGYRMALISNAADDPNTQVLVDKLGVRDFFEVIVSSAASGVRKPNPKIFQTALERMNLNPNSVAMVGDTLGADILGARNAGIFSIWIKRRANTPGNWAHSETIIPDAQIESLSDLPDLLENLTVL